MKWSGLDAAHADDPAATLRWVRRVELAFVPFAVLVAVAAAGDRARRIWWLCCVSAASACSARRRWRPAIRRAERRPHVDPIGAGASGAAEAELLTGVTYAAMAGIAIVLGYAFSGLQAGGNPRRDVRGV